MRTSTTSLAALGAGFLLSVGMAAAPAHADPAVVIQTPYAQTMSHAAPSGDDQRTAGEWSCGLLRLDGWAGGWRVVVGANYDLPGPLVLTLNATGDGWTLGEGHTFGNADSNPAADLDLPRSAESPGYFYIDGQAARVDIAAGQETITIEVADGLSSGEYFNVALPKDTDAAAGTRVVNTLTANYTCGKVTPEPTPTGGPTATPTVSPTGGPTPSVRPTGTPVATPPTKVNAGAVESGANGLAVIALGAATVTGLAVYGRNRAKKG
ncbi:MAG: hypothetical protein Q4F67_08885 [Propionibacteriaceae bacterium]|nr:hypothetical protein [Propionibacteriaceae bacterium]